MYKVSYMKAMWLDARTEGGDVLIAREDTLFIGNGGRTNTKGIKYLAETFACIERLSRRYSCFSGHLKAAF